jgi:hypothetical protein
MEVKSWDGILLSESQIVIKKSYKNQWLECGRVGDAVDARDDLITNWK